jgi:hypothetical protein
MLKMETKVCNRCSKEKEIILFRKRKDSKDGHRKECAECSSVLGKKYGENNKEWVKFRKKKDYQKNREKRLKKVKEYRLKNLEVVREKDRLRSKKMWKENPDKLRQSFFKNKDKRIATKKLWEVKNKEKLKSQKKEYVKKRKSEDILYYLKLICRNRLYHFLKTKNITKKNTTFEIVGCSPQELKEHLENKFVLGMDWENRMEWHIDHIVPLSSAKTEDELYKLCHYTNLQPLWVEENLKKSNKILN